MVRDYELMVGKSVVLYDAQKLNWKPAYGFRSYTDFPGGKKIITHNDRYAIIRHKYTIARLQQEEKGAMWDYVLECQDVNIENHPDYLGGAFGGPAGDVIRCCRYQIQHSFSSIHNNYNGLLFNDIPDYCSDSDAISSSSFRNIMHDYYWWKSGIMDKKRKCMELEQELAAYKQMAEVA